MGTILDVYRTYYLSRYSRGCVRAFVTFWRISRLTTACIPLVGEAKWVQGPEVPLLDYGYHPPTIDSLPVCGRVWMRRSRFNAANYR